ncbi:protein PHOX1-like [Andrographis paniculata]|uniref:protein PHOX1-like n=1 Tax=Andrographis paniculata TaxID=175694 RepID=UPI0021E7A42B|nr:protein PHOX1-like [Andrographis paniculata]
MGKPSAKKKAPTGLKSKSSEGTIAAAKHKAFDEDTAVFINMSQELKEEGNKLFQKHDHEGAMLTYEKALKLLPPNHIDIANLRTNMAACYMQMGIGEYPRALNECNLALQVAPKYSKALLRRARCYEALNRLNLALRDVNTVLTMEPNNTNALEISDVLRKKIDESGVQVDDKEIVLPSDYVEPAYAPPVARKVVKEKGKKKKGTKLKRKSADEPQEKNVDVVEEKKIDSNVIVEEKRSVNDEKTATMKSVKLVHGEDIRWAQYPANCGLRRVRNLAVERFSNLKGVLVKYKDADGDLVTITTTDELRIAEGLADRQSVLRLYIAEVSPEKEPIYDEMDVEEEVINKSNDDKAAPVEDWIVEFARVFKNHVGLDSDSYLDLHEIGMKMYSEAMEDSVTGDDAQGLFDIAAATFQEMTALALFNWGNAHLSKARKKVILNDDNSPESQIKSAFDWAENEYNKAATKFEECLKFKPNFYEGHLALGLQKFEQAKLSWYYMIASKSKLEIGPSSHVLELYNRAEDCMEKGMQIWEEMEEERLNGISKREKDKTELRKFGLDGLYEDISGDDAADKATNMRAQIYLLWGTMLYERSVVEYKLSLPTWEECLEVAVEKFELAGASQTDITFMIKNHCSNATALQGFKVDEIVQAWNEMYDADKWRAGVATFRLEPLFRRRTPKLHALLERTISDL